MRLLINKLQHRATVKQRVTDPNSNTEVDETTVYENIPCHIFRKGDKWINIAFGTSNLGKWTMLAPHTWQGNKIRILVNYFVYWNDTVNGVNRRLMVIGCNNEYDTHVQVDLEEMT
jgi:hypothetical protein